MATLNGLTANDQVALEREVQSRTRGCRALETAAQQYTDLLCERFPADVLLARLFVTVPYGSAPVDVRAFVDQLAKKTGISDRIRDDTLILSLAGTSGKEPDWNDRRRSHGHAGIPLATADFIDAVPMMSRLLRELGLGLDWIDARDTTIIARSLGSSSGVFYVREAANETDTQGRKVIAAQDFVREHGVQTVFGIGGAYMGTASFLVNIVFCKTLVERPRVEALMPLINRVKVSTVELAKAGRIFAS